MFYFFFKRLRMCCTCLLCCVVFLSGSAVSCMYLQPQRSVLESTQCRGCEYKHILQPLCKLSPHPSAWSENHHGHAEWNSSCTNKRTKRKDTKGLGHITPSTQHNKRQAGSLIWQAGSQTKKKAPHVQGTRCGVPLCVTPVMHPSMCIRMLDHFVHILQEGMQSPEKWLATQRLLYLFEIIKKEDRKKEKG